MRIRYTPLALSDLESIYDYLNERSLSGARNVLAAIHHAIAYSAEQPLSSQVTDDPTLRMKLVSQYPYKIFYRIGGDAVDVIHIRHSSRQPWKG